MPSRARRSGVAVMFRAIAISDGPVSGGSLTSWTVHAAAKTAAISPQTENPFILRSPEIRKVDRDAADDGDFVADRVRPVERHVRDDGQHDWLGAEIDQR